KINPAKLYIPCSCQEVQGSKELIRVKSPVAIHENIFSTGELNAQEQSLVIRYNRGVVVIAGCSHPGVREILQASSNYGRVVTLIGGLHGFKEFDLIQDLESICPTHCTQFKEKIRSLYPDKYIEGAAGRIITI
ncbi:MAG: MBL fold metallo-hydrolase, partial [Desulfobacterales bacterium]|nr:MBL fold metallo-hydrolase [Desulfobacterales bacterium]